MCKISACEQHRYCNAFCAVSLFFISFCRFLLLLFLTMNPHYMTSYNLVFYCSIKKKKKGNCFFFFCCNNVCLCASCVMAINYVCAVQSLMSTLDWECVSVCL